MIGPLDQEFSVIIGPNGCGKSNLLESLLFVFGKKARKMRLNKLAQLIHKSSALEGEKCAKTAVAVFFRDADGTEFSIKRTVDQNANSRYYFNDSHSSFAEVTERLKSKGIDLTHDRFLILQGEVE